MLNEGKSTMASANFPVHRMHAIAAASAAACVALNIAVHLCTPLLWAGYRGASYKTKLAWCNRIVSAVHACVLMWNQWDTIFDPVMTADPLHAVTDRHFVWSSVCYGYIIYDTLYEASRMLYEKAGNASFLFHHAIGLACCCVGLYLRRMAYFGAVIQVFFEATTPLMHALGCMKTMGWDNSNAYAATGLLFAAMYFICRVVISNYFGWVMLRAVLAEASPSVWDWGGVALYTMLSVLNALWFARICGMFVKGLQKRKAREPGAPSGSRTAHKQRDGEKTAQDLIMGNTIKGATDASQMHERKQAKAISAVQQVVLSQR